MIDYMNKIYSQYEFTDQLLFETIGKIFYDKYNNQLVRAKEDKYDVNNSEDLTFMNNRIQAFFAIGTCLMLKFNEIDNGIAMIIATHQLINYL